MSSPRQEITVIKERSLPIKRTDSFKASSSQQQNDAQRQQSTSSTRTEESEQPEQQPVDGDSDSVSDETREKFLKPPSKWTLEDTIRLISTRGTGIVYEVDANGEPLFWDAVKTDRLDCANILLDYAKSNELLVKFTCEGGDLLGWAIDVGSCVHAEFILDKLTGKYGSLEETINLLRSHLSNLISRFPKLILGYLKEDKFTVEYARFEAPKALFGRKGKTPVGMSIDSHPENWKAMTSGAAFDFWMNKSVYGKLLEEDHDKEIKVVAKFSCVNLMEFLRSDTENSSIVRFHLLGTTKVAERFKSTTLRVFVNWLYDFYRNIYFLGLVLDVVVAVTFTSFAILYSRAHDEVEPIHRGFAIALITAPCIANLIAVFCSFSVLRVMMLIIDVMLFLHTCITEVRTQYSTFTSSIGCILCWIVFFRTLRPFGQLGPFVSMVGYALWDSLPFAMMGFLLVLGYSSAFMVLYNDRLGDIDGDNFDTFPHAIETLFHTGLGNFENDMLRPSSDFLAVWRALLFNSFVYIGPIVLMSLLVSILSDTHDRVRSKEKAERTMHRLQAIVDCTMIGGFVEWCSLHEPCGKLCSVWIWNKILCILREKYKELQTVEKMHFHFLVPEDTEEESSDKEWHGRLNALEKTIKSEAGKNKKALTEIDQKTTDELVAVFKEMGNVGKTMSDMKTSVDQILHEFAKLKPSLG